MVLNIETVASLSFPNISTGGTMGEGTAQNAVVTHSFLSLLLSLLAGTRISEVIEGGGPPLQSIDLDLAYPDALPQEDIEDTVKKGEVPDTEISGILLSLGQNCYQANVLPRHSGDEQQTSPPITVESGRCKEISPGPILADEPSATILSEVIAETKGVPLSPEGMEDEGSCPKETASIKSERPVDHSTIFPEIFEEIREGQAPVNREQTLGRMNSIEEGIKNGRSELTGAISNTGETALPNGQDNPGKETEKVRILHQFTAVADERIVKDRLSRETRYLKQEDIRPVMTGKDPVVDGTLHTGPQDAHRFDTIFPKPPDGRPEDVISREIVKQIVENAHLFVGKDVMSLKLQLKPEILGNLKLTIKVEHGLVHARFTAENTAVAHLIETHLPELQNIFADRGIAWHQMSVSVDSQMNSGGFANAGQEGGGYTQQYAYPYITSPSGQDGRDEASTAGYYYGNEGTVDYLI